jgi:hypothetical protein
LPRWSNVPASVPSPHYGTMIATFARHVSCPYMASLRASAAPGDLPIGV